MDKKIIKTGLSCKVNAKVMLMKCFLDSVKDRVLVIQKMTQQKCGGTPVPEEFQEYFAEEYGIWINSVTRLDDERLTKAYDSLKEDGIIERWLSGQTPDMRRRAEEILKWDQEEVTIDITPFLVYAIVENDRCRQQLMEYMEDCGEACFRAYRESLYCDSPLMEWFPQQNVLAAMLCIGLLEQIRAEDRDKKAYETFITIASGGFKWVKRYVKQREELDGEVFRRILAETDPGVDQLSCLCTGIMGFLMAEEVEAPIRMDFLLLSFLPVLQDWSKNLLEAPEPVEISEDGIRRCREIMEEYHCNKSGWIAGCICREVMDFADIFPVFGWNQRKLQTITMTEKEMQQLFSLYPDISGEAVAPVLMAAALCKYARQLEERYCPEDELKQLGEIREVKVQKELDHGRFMEVKKELEHLQQEEMQLRRERDALAERIGELEQTVFRRREQMEQMKNQQEHAKREIKELQNFVCYLTEHPEEKAEEGDKNNNSRRRGQRLNLARRRVVVIGGHENWQRRFREQFPMWQFLSADKNNFDAGCVRNKEIIIVNTAVLKHSCYYRIMAERSEGQTVLYVHGNNLERCLDELERQIETA